MTQGKFRVTAIRSGGRCCLCVASNEGRRIEIEALNEFTAVEINDTVLVAYEESQTLRAFQYRLKGKIIAHDAGGVLNRHNEFERLIQMSILDPHRFDMLRPISTDLFKPKIKEEKEMQNHLVELLLENFYTVGIRFKNSTKVYTYKVDKDLTLVEEDRVIVETTSGLEIVDVVRVDEGSNIDYADNIKYKFIVQKVDTTRYDELVATDAKVSKIIAQGEAEQTKQNLLTSFCGNLSDGQVKLLEDCGAKAVKRL